MVYKRCIYLYVCESASYYRSLVLRFMLSFSWIAVALAKCLCQAMSLFFQEEKIQK